MQKQPHRAVEKTADNRYWQNQFHNDDAELEPTAEFQEYEPPKLTPPIPARWSEHAARVKLGGMKPDLPEAPATHAAQQVAYAWQVAVRDLRFTHPELHAQLSEKRAQAARRRGARRPRARDPAPAGERSRGDRSRSMRRGANSTNCGGARRRGARHRRKVPAAEAARLRMRTLIDAGSRGSGLPPRAQQRNVDPAELAPSREALREVAEGRRTLTREEREWCVGEAMVLTGFLRTPVQLLEDGEQEIARIILDGARRRPESSPGLRRGLSTLQDHGTGRARPWRSATCAETTTTRRSPCR